MPVFGFFKSTLASTSTQRSINRAAGFSNIASYALTQAPINDKNSELIIPGIIFFTYLYGVLRADAPTRERVQALFLGILNLVIWILRIALTLYPDKNSPDYKNLKTIMDILQLVYLASYLPLAGTGEVLRTPPAEQNIPPAAAPAVP